MRTEATATEAEQLKQGKGFDQRSLLQRFSAQVSQFSEITISIDAAFFEDGTFVGPDTTNFFNQTKAVVDAKRDFLNELAAGLSSPGNERDSIYRHFERTASQTVEPIDSGSTPTDYYNYFKKLSAGEFLQSKDAQGEEKAIAMALRPLKKPWTKLRKKIS